MIKVKYFYKENHVVKRVFINYNLFLKMIGYNNKVDNKGQNYNCGHTYQLLYFQNLLLNNKEPNIFKCNFYLCGEQIPI